MGKLIDEKCAICGKLKMQHTMNCGVGMCQLYPTFVSERAMAERLTRPPIVTDEVVEDIAWLRERAYSTEKGGDEEILTRIADRLASCLPRERMNNMAEVVKLKTSADYIEVQQCASMPAVVSGGQT